MPVIPPTVLKRLYVQGSLRLENHGFAFDLKNLIAPATITDFCGLDIDGDAIDDELVKVVPPSGNSRPIGQISAGTPLDFPVGVVITVQVTSEPLEPGEHELTLHLKVKEIGSLDIPISDTVQ